MKMFDWDDQELANIIWGEGREADDHIVPFPEDIEKKDWPDYGDNHETTLNEEDIHIKAAENISSTSKLFLDGGNQEENDHKADSRIVVDSQLDVSSFATSKTDNDPIAKKTVLYIGSEALGHQNDTNELGELVGNSWANIGSFDDLDRIFSNDELEGQTSLPSTDELWSSSRDLVSGAAKSSSAVVGSRAWEFEALGNTSSHTEPNSEYPQHDNPSATTSDEKIGSASSYSRRRTARYEEQERYSQSTPALIEEKGVWSKRQQKYKQTTGNATDSRLLGDVCDSWPSPAANISQYDRIRAQTTVQNFQAPHQNQQWLPNESRATAYHTFMNPHAPCGYEKFPQQYPAMQVMKPKNDEPQSMLCSSAVYQGDIVSLNTSVQTMGRTMKMTPQEKIEKLRRRQQMRALLAIQKQQQQLRHQSSAVDYPLSQNSCQEHQVLLIQKADLESDGTVPFYDPLSPSKRDDLSTISDMDEHSVEDTVLYRLQDVIERLDTKIRLCIKDSLYRLADSATERHHASDTSASNRTGACNLDVAKEEISSQHRVGEDANMETETNQIDRVVAHLLFHRPLKLSVRHVETPGSSTSNRICIEQETGGSRVPNGLLVKNCEREFDSSPCGLKNPRTSADSCLENMANDISETENTVNPQIMMNMTEQAD